MSDYVASPPSAVISNLEGAQAAGWGHATIIDAGVDALAPWSLEQRYELLVAAVNEQSLVSVSAAVAADACASATDTQLVALLHRILISGASLKTRASRDAFLLSPSSRGDLTALLETIARNADGSPVLHDRGLAQLMDAVRSCHMEEIDESGPRSLEYTAQNHQRNCVAIQMSAPFVREVVRCGGRRPNADASQVAIELALWGSVELVQLLVTSGYAIDTVSADRWATGMVGAWEQLAHPLATYSVAHAAAFAGHEHVLSFLESRSPSVAARRDHLYGLAARELYPPPNSPPSSPPSSPPKPDRQYEGAGSQQLGPGRREADLPQAVPSGDWPIDEAALPADYSRLRAHCGTIDVEPASLASNASAFVDAFVVRRRPILLRGALHGTSADHSLTPYAAAWTRQALLNKLGDSEWRVASIPYEHEFTGGQPQQTTLRAFVAAHIDRPTGGKARNDAEGTCHAPARNGSVPYIFTSTFSHRKSTIPVAALSSATPHWGADLANSPHTQLYLGPAGSGANWHYHNAAWNLLGYGRKLWILTPPQNSAFSTSTPSQTLSEEVHALTEQERGGCRLVEQSAGDLLVLPEGWGHLTFNVRASIGIAREFALPSAFVASPRWHW